MCGRYTLKAKGVDLQRELNLDHEPVLEPRFNIAPTQAAPIILDTNPRELVLARWGFAPQWLKNVNEGAKHINARAESIYERPTFKGAIAHARCLVPCDGFYEWKHHGRQSTPIYLSVPTHPIQTLAGLWTTWRSPEGLEVVTYSIVTRASNEFMSRIHTRMPVFIAPEAREAWLTKEATPSLVEGLLHSAPPELTAVEVAPHVNKVGVDDARCLEPAAAVQLDLL
jgi:putative SOS response-associated peptidase YedK